MRESLINESIINDQILHIEINNPPVNVLSRQVRNELSALFSNLKDRTNIRVLLISGSNQVFCCGDDLKEAYQNLVIGIEHVKRSLSEFGKLMRQIETCHIPTIALIDGWCIGGGLELALCTDIRLASPNAKFKGAGVNIGLMASTYRLPQLIGLGKSKELLLTAQVINAEQALEIGLINQLSNENSILDLGKDIAHSIVQKAPLSVIATKKSLNNSYQLTMAENEAINKAMLMSLAESQDYKRAVFAHMKKEKPSFKGN